MPLRLAAVLASAVAYGVLFAPFDWVAASWVCLVPLYLALQGVSRRAAFALAGFWGFAATLVIIAWLVSTLIRHFEWSTAPSVALWVAFSLAAMAPFTAAALGLGARPARPLARAALFAAGWVAAEYARTHLGLASPWTKLGDAHADSPHLRQIADLGGVYAVSGVVAFANAAIGEGIAGIAARRRALAPLAAAAGLVALALLYGATRAGTSRGSGFEVAIVQGNVAAELRWNRAAAGRVLRRYGGLTRDLLQDASGPPPALIVWPENAIQTQLDDAVYGLPLRRLADRVPLLVGAPRSEERGGVRHSFNSVLLLRPDGGVDSYDKRRLLPFSETRPLGELVSLGARGDLDVGAYTAGEHAGFFEVGGRRLAVLICMEALYPELAREAARGGATLLVNPSNDGWYEGYGGAGQHLAQVRFRAIETRLPIVRATTTGISAVIAPDGTLLGRLEEGVSGVLRVDLPGAGEAPPYARFGDVFAWVCIALWSGFALVSWLRSAPTS